LSIYKQKIDHHYNSKIKVETLQKIIYEYFENIDEETLYDLCKDIIIKYVESQDRLKIKSCSNLFKIYSKNNGDNITKIFEQKLLIWKHKTKFLQEIYSKNNNIKTKKKKERLNSSQENIDYYRNNSQMDIEAENSIRSTHECDSNNIAYYSTKLNE